MVTHTTFNSSTGEGKGEGQMQADLFEFKAWYTKWVPGQPRLLHRKTLFQTNNNKTNKKIGKEKRREGKGRRV